MKRRTFLGGAAALTALPASGAWAQRRRRVVSGQSRDVVLDRLLAGWFEGDLHQFPASATNLGLDTGAGAALRGRLNDESGAELARTRQRAQARAGAIARFAPAGLSPAALVSRDIAAFRFATQAEGARFRYGSATSPSPYVVTQRHGSYSSIPNFLDTQHPVRTPEDADYYLARLTQFGTNLGLEAARIRDDAAAGVIPPDFIVDKAIGNLERLRGLPAAETVLVRSLVRRTGEARVAGDWAARATQLVEGPVRAGLDAQLAALRELRPRARHEAGVRRLPDGEAYYAWALKTHTTTTMGADEIHRIGLQQVADLQRQIDTLLRAQGRTRGTVGERINALNREPANLWPNTDAGREELLASLRQMVRAITPLLPRVFSTLPRAEVEIRRVPPIIERGASGGSYQAAPLDGSRPGIFWINLQDTADQPKHSLPTLTYHEAVPGHHFQNMVTREAGELPLYRRIQNYAAYGEGWALYSERVADELGVYANDPLGRIGYLQAYLFRAVRLVVDTGLHHLGWSRERAIRYMVDNAAEPEGSSANEIERYAVMPGQACSYKIGQTVIARLRAAAEARPGFDIRRFHDAVLGGGPMPLAVLERQVRAAMRG